MSAMVRRKTEAVAAWLLAIALAAAVVAAVAAPGKSRVSSEEERLNAAREALARGRADEARALLASIPAGRLPKEKEDAAAYLRSLLVESGVDYERGLTEYLTRYPRGVYRREATLAMAKLRYVQGDYTQAENLLAIFSPGAEKSVVGREALVTRGLAQLGRGDAAGALAFLTSAEGDLKGSPEEEAYYFAVAEAALRASRPAAATPALRVILEKHAQGDYAPQALYAMGTVLEMVGRQADAANVFRQVAQRFPLSYEATRVRDRGIRPGAEGSSPLPIGGGFAVQIGAFSRRDLAEALARDLRQNGVADVSVRPGSETPPIFRVRAGSYASRDQARALGERLRRDRGFSYQVVPR